MGIQRTIRFPTGEVPEWPVISAKLLEIGESLAVRMIDNLPAFPDEIPEPGWQELRLSLSGGMVTLRRIPAGFSCVAWGNSDAALIKSWDRLAWAVAAAGDGLIEVQPSPQTADEFRKSLG